MNSLPPFKNIFRNKTRYIILFVLFLPLIVGVLSSANILSALDSYSAKTNEKYGGTVDIHFTDYIGLDIKKALSKLDCDKYLKEIYYPAVETNSNILFDKLNIEYIQNDIKSTEKKDEKNRYIGFGISFIGLDTKLLEYSGEKFELIEGRMFENDNECIINKEKYSQFVFSSLNIGDKVILSGSGDNIELTVVGIAKAEPPYGESGNPFTGSLLYTTQDTVVKLATQYRPGTPDVDPGMNLWYEKENPFSVSNYFGVNNRDSYGYKCVGILKDYKQYGDFQQFLLSQNKDIKKSLTSTHFYNFDEGVFSISGQIVISSLIFLIIIISMLIITTVVTSIMYLSNRKYEFAVLCSVGMSKPKIMGSYILETLSFMLFTSLVAIGIGQLVFIFGLSNTVKSAFEGWIDTSLPMANILAFNGVAVLAGMSIVVVVTVLISMIYLLSFEPLKIFNKRYS